MERKATVERKTAETEVKLTINLDGRGEYKISTEVPFLDHMLSLFAKHGLFDLEIVASGDTQVGEHHIVEDIGISLGEAIKKGLGDKRGINRYGNITLPMDEALVSCTVDISGRPFLIINTTRNVLPFRKSGQRFLQDTTLFGERIADFKTELVDVFFRALVNTLGLTLHINLLYGNDPHHIIEAIFKGVGKALSQAVEINPRVSGIPSTKGII
ncbi:MAG: imidazoleglycerol-phosphate dehydratase HisB [bacterium]|nr:imidazoleglycerol-phosphate dehydratase HisB [bacterium]